MSFPRVFAANLSLPAVPFSCDLLIDNGILNGCSQIFGGGLVVCVAVSFSCLWMPDNGTRA
jgi:hypothetical protein